MSTDVIVVGAGIVGAACARALAQAGAEVVVVDRSAAVSGTSASGEGNLLVSDKGPGPELELARRAAELWPQAVAELEAELGKGFPSLEFELKGGIVVATTEGGAQGLRDFAQQQRSVGVEARELDRDEVYSLEPWLSPDVVSAVHYPGDAQVQPVVAAEAFLASARRAGARVLPNVEVRGAILDGARLVGVQTTAGPMRAPHILLAAGPWSADVAATLGVGLPVRPRRGTVLVTSRMPHRVFHKVYDADYVGAVGSDDGSLQTSSVVEATAAGTVLIGSSRQQVGFDTALEVQVLREIARKAVRLFPMLAGIPIIRAYSGFRPFMPDHLPVISADHRMEGLWHATGHEGAGIGLSLATAELIAALMLGARSGIDPTPFALSRPSLASHLQEVS